MPDHAETCDPSSESPTASHVPEAAGAGTLDFPAPNPGSVDSGPDAVPGYEVFGEVGRGGMGVVYRARDTRLNRDVALKMIRRADTSRLTVARFWAEAEVMAAVKHPHVVQVHELGEYDGRPFIAMEFLPGGSLETRLASGPTPPREAAELVAKVASGVAAAHALGIVHRDLKPANILLASDGTPKVTDFGLAKRLTHDLTQSLALLGTPAYMAPEQAAGRAKFVGPPGDVWALGVILYECVAGKRPFDGDTREELLFQIQSAEPRPLRTWLGSVPRDLDTIVSKCLSKEPEHRYPTAAELADDLGRFVRGEPITARPVGSLERLVRWARRKPTAATAYGSSALAVVLAVVAFTVFGFWHEAEGAKKQAESARDQLAGEKKLTEAARDEAVRLGDLAEKSRAAEFEVRRKLEVFEYGRTIQVAHQEWRDNNFVRARALLQGTKPELRSWEWNYVHRLCHSSLLTITGHTERLNTASFSPDGTRIVTDGDGNTAKIWDAMSGRELLTLRGHTKWLGSASFSRDGTRVVTSSYDKTAKLWDAHTGKELRTFRGHQSDVDSASFSPDGLRIITTSCNDGLAKVWDAKTGAEVYSLKEESGFWFRAAFSRDGTRIVTGGEFTPRVWDAKAGAPLFTLNVPENAGTTTSVAFSPDGTRIATGMTDHTARIWDAKTGKELLKLQGHTDQICSVEFSPDGSRVVTSGADDKTVRVWDAKSGKELLVLREFFDTVCSASYSPDGTRIVTAGTHNAVNVWDAKVPAEALTIGEFQQFVSGAALDPDGVRVVTSDTSAEPVRLWNAKSGAALRTFDEGNVFALSFSPDGSRILTDGPDATARVWDVNTGAKLLTLKGHTSSLRSASFNADGSHIVTGGSDRTAKVWDARTGKELLTLHGHTGDVLAASFCADGTNIVTGSSDKTARVWDAQTGVERFTLRGHTGEVNSASFSRDGTLIATASDDSTARIWDAKLGAEMRRLAGHTDKVLSVSFGPDGSRLVTGSSDGTARIWEPRTGAEVLTLKGHTWAVTTASFSADGTCIVTGGDRTVRVWNATPLNHEFRSRELAPPPRPAIR